MCATDAAFHLVHKIDVEHTLARLAHYEALNKAHIAQHQQQREQESAQQDEADADVVVDPMSFGFGSGKTMAAMYNK